MRWLLIDVTGARCRRIEMSGHRGDEARPLVAAIDPDRLGAGLLGLAPGDHTESDLAGHIRLRIKGRRSHLGVLLFGCDRLPKVEHRSVGGAEEGGEEM